ncbi:MAG: serine hydrolase [Bacteroidota bacterium]
MRKKILFLLVFLTPILLSAQESPKSIEQFVKEVDQKISPFLMDFSIPGAAIAIIENGDIVLQKGYGFADVEKGISVTKKTGFNIASISKTITAWGIMKLVEDEKIDLDAPAEKYLSRWQLPESAFDSEEVTIRRLLSHTAGLSLHGYPGWGPKDTLPTIEESLNGKNNGPGRVEIMIEPGTRYQYSGGGYSILQLIIEEVSGQTFEEYMQAEVLNPLGMHNSSFAIDDKIMAASASEYDNLGGKIDFERFTAQAAAGLHTTIEDFTRFALASLYRSKDQTTMNPVLSAKVVQQMMEPAPATKGEYGLGYELKTRETEKGLGGHSGSNAGWQALFWIDPASNDGFIVFTNGRAGWNLANLVFCECINWKNRESPWNDCHIRPPISSKLKQLIDAKGVADLKASYMTFKQEQADVYDFSESQLNNLGYHYLAREEYEKAIAVFKLNIDAFPYAWNAYDSYGEALLVQGAREDAIENYKQSIRLNPENENGKTILKGLGIAIDDLIMKIPIEQLKILEGEYIATSDPQKKIVYAVEKGELVRKYQDYSTRLVPIGNNEFVYLGRGIHVVFDTRNPDAIFLTTPDNSEFKQVK